MIDTTRPVTVTQTGLDILSQGDSEPQLFTFGKILLLRKDHCVVLVAAGPKAGKKVQMPLTFPATVDGATYHVDMPAADAVKEKRVKPAPGESKIAKCRAIYAAFPFSSDLKADRAAIIQKFIDDVKCTPQGAVTYYITCSKE